MYIYVIWSFIYFNTSLFCFTASKHIFIGLSHNIMQCYYVLLILNISLKEKHSDKQLMGMNNKKSPKRSISKIFYIHYVHKI